MIRLAPVVFFVSAVFLFVGVHEYTLPLSQFSYMAETDDTIIYDCFSHIKMVAVIITACVSAIMMSYYFLIGKRNMQGSSAIIRSEADTFMFVFPQDDYITRYSHGLSKDCVYDKPHNMFLQIAVRSRF